MAKTVYLRTSLTGGGANDLDGIDGGGLSDGDIAFVFNTDGRLYTYELDTTIGGGGNPPYLIEPVSNAGSKRWVLFMPYVEAGELASSSSESSSASSSSSLSSSSLSSSSASSSSSSGV